MGPLARRAKLAGMKTQHDTAASLDVFIATNDEGFAELHYEVPRRLTGR